MANALHSQQTPDDGIHVPYAWTFANATDRINGNPSSGPSPISSADIGKLGRQTDDDSLWMLTGVGPLTWSAVGGGGGQSTVAFDAYDSAGGTTLGATFTDIPLGTTRKATPDFSHTAGAPEVTVNVGGTFIVVGRMTYEISAGTSRSEAESQLLLDTGGGYSVVPGSLARSYHRNSAQGSSTTVSFAILDLNAGDKLKMQGRRSGGTSTIVTTAGGSSLMIFSTQGPQGPPGPPGGNDPNAIHVNVAGEIAGISAKTDTDGGDLLVIEDSAAANAKKSLALSDLKPISSVQSGGATSGSSFGTMTLIPGMTITPAAGDYTVFFWADCQILGASDWVEFAIFVAGAEMPISRCRVEVDDFQSTRVTAYLMGRVATVNGAQAIEARFQTQDSTGVTFRNRRLLVRKET